MLCDIIHKICPLKNIYEFCGEHKFLPISYVKGSLLYMYIFEFISENDIKALHHSILTRQTKSY